MAEDAISRSFDFAGLPAVALSSLKMTGQWASYCEIFGACERRWVIAVVKQKHKVHQGDSPADESAGSLTLFRMTV
jgi:hypothetical protein